MGKRNKISGVLEGKRKRCAMESENCDNERKWRHGGMAAEERAQQSRNTRRLYMRGQAAAGGRTGGRAGVAVFANVRRVRVAIGRRKRKQKERMQAG